MNPRHDIPAPRSARIATGALLLLAIILVQLATYSRLIGAYEANVAERWPEGKKGLEEQLETALAADPTSGWAIWQLSKEKLRQAMVARTLAAQLRTASEEALSAGKRQTANKLLLAEKLQNRKQDSLLKEAEDLAKKGTYCFNSVGCYKQLASIYLRQTQTENGEQYVEKAERQLQTVARIKPNDIEAIERLGMFKLRAGKWDELEELTEVILRRHPYSANAYFYRAFIAKERDDTDAFFLNVRQAYIMMIQETGTIFFNRKQLEELAVRLGVVDAPPPARK